MHPSHESPRASGKAELRNIGIRNLARVVLGLINGNGYYASLIRLIFACDSFIIMPQSAALQQSRLESLPHDFSTIGITRFTEKMALDTLKSLNRYSQLPSRSLRSANSSLERRRGCSHAPRTCGRVASRQRYNMLV